MQVSTLSALLTAHAEIHGLAVTETSGRDSKWVAAFAKALGFDVGDWKWNRALQMWELTLEQRAGRTHKPAARVVLQFHEGNKAYVLGNVIYHPLFWLDRAFARLVKRRKPLSEALYEEDSNKDVFRVLNSLAAKQRDDFDPLTRITLFLQEAHQAGNFSFTFEQVRRDKLVLIGERELYKELLELLEPYGYKIMIQSALEGAKFTVMYTGKTPN